MATKKKATSKAKTKKPANKKAKVSTASVKGSSSRITIASLGKWNIVLAIILAIQAIIIFLASQPVSLPVVTRYLTTDALASQAAKSTVLAPAVRHLFDVNVAAIVAAFLLVSAAAHAALATVHRKRYEAGLTERVNRTRWIDYTIGASLIMIVIGLINGVYDLASLVMITALVVLLHGLAYKNELYNKDKPVSWRQFWGILLAGGAVWVTIALYVKGAIMYGTGLPKYIYWLDATTFLILLAMAANIWLTTAKKGRWADYLFAERSYMILSFVLKAAIAWQIFFGLLK